MQQSIHGGDLYKTANSVGIRKEDILDFSANINPLGLSQQLKEALIAHIDDIINYPDLECNELRDELSKYTGIPKEAIIAGNGASEMLYLLFDVLRPGKTLIPAPCFSEYAKAAENYGSEICYYELKEEDNFRLSIPHFLQHITDGIDAVLICNPNNPTSTLIDKKELLELIEYTRKRNIYIIIDEAFIELTIGGNQNSVADYLKQYQNLFVIRALTKILAIPGLRLGYVLGDSCIIKRMWKNKIPWSVNSFACNIGKVLTENVGYFEATTAWLAAEKEWLYNELIKISKLKVFKPDTNFILMKIVNMDMNSASLKVLMISKGILIRDASNFKFLNDKFVRVAIKDRKSNSRLVEALRVVLNNAES